MRWAHVVPTGKKCEWEIHRTEPLLSAIATSPEEDGASWAVTGASHDANNLALCVGHKAFFYTHNKWS